MLSILDSKLPLVKTLSEMGVTYNKFLKMWIFRFYKKLTASEITLSLAPGPKW
jgi:hypothetical protein